MSRKSRDLRERFFEKVDKTGTCWLWTGMKNRKGYGRIGISRGVGMKLAHRISLELHGVRVPDEMCVLHTCDVPSCVNPTHLFLGTRADNNLDMRAKGRANYVAWKYVKPEQRARGEDVAKTMTDVKVKELRIEYANGNTSFVKLGKKYGIGRTTVENIIKRRKWAHVQ